ncbi:suppressor protein SRP40-like isoform X2 [Mangifera indica]|uniref:suppressor protein SRP40-like isoform X2 n=1 Tax=Mangifera indica TaxID=29780 RepID=UPI001CFB02D8|nr:suppressor protein SRP40-like isoform X2 [Mangifera indica]
MVSDSVTNASIPSNPNCKDFGKKKRTNRTAKLKQYKLDARREQWLSLVKSRGCKDGLGDGRKERDRSLLNSRQRDEDNNNERSIHHESDSESPSNSPINSPLSSGGTDSATNFGGSSSSSSSSSSSGSSVCESSTGGCCSGSITEEEDDCLDDWEAVADALAASDDKNNNKPQGEHDKPCHQSPSESHLSVQSDSPHELTCEFGLDSVNSMADSATVVPRRSGNNMRAWRPDDAFRPQSLPNLAKQRSFPASGRHFVQGGVPWTCNNVLTVPSSCPICCEELDFTDSNFLPCLCGFRLCLFCHKRILEEDGRCPGCRKPYKPDEIELEATVQGGSLTYRLARSYSMIARS